MDTKTIADLDLWMLKAIVGLCPKKPGDSVTITVTGTKQPVTLTIESRAKGLAELARRSRAKKEKK